MPSPVLSLRMGLVELLSSQRITARTHIIKTWRLDLRLELSSGVQDSTSYLSANRASLDTIYPLKMPGPSFSLMSALDRVHARDASLKPLLLSVDMAGAYMRVISDPASLIVIPII